MNFPWLPFASGARTAAFSPASLFASGQQGVWYDPSDTTTMFEDSTGLTPVHVPGNGTADSPIGFLLDKRNPSYSGVFTGTEYLTTTYNPDAFDWWTTDFTIEGWFYASSFASFNRNVVGNMDPIIGYNYWQFGPNSSNQLQFDYYNGGTNFLYSTATLNVGAWNHCAMTNTGSGITLFVNGVASSTTPVSGTPQSGAAIPTPLCIGQYNGTPITGSISNLRIVKGTAVYTGNFTPPTSPLTAIVNTKLLLFGNAYSGNPTFSITGSYSVSSATPFNSSVPGNHATQSTSTARPTLSARYNLLTYSEQFDNAAWPKVDTSVTANQIVAPDGTTTADFLKEAATTNRHIVYQNVSSPASTNYTFSVCAKAGTRSFISVLLNDVSGNIYATVFDLINGVVASSNTVNSPTGTSNAISSLGSGWYRCTVKMNCFNGNTFQIIGLSNTGTPSSFTFGSPNYTGDGTSGLYIWGADWRPTNDGVGLPVYQRIADANTYDSTGFPYYIKSDGVDDGLSTGNINWGTNRVTLNVGIRNLSSGADNAAIEFYNGTLSGAWSLNRSNASSWWKFYSNGGTGTDTTGAAQVIPFTEVITATGYTAGTTNVFRENGTQTGSNTATQGSGNYGTYPIWMLKRYNGTLLWAGRLYGAIARGASSTASEIANTETWLNGKTKAY